MAIKRVQHAGEENGSQILAQDEKSGARLVGVEGRIKEAMDVRCQLAMDLGMSFGKKSNLLVSFSRRSSLFVPQTEKNRKFNSEEKKKLNFNSHR